MLLSSVCGAVDDLELQNTFELVAVVSFEMDLTSVNSVNQTCGSWVFALWQLAVAAGCMYTVAAECMYTVAAGCLYCSSWLWSAAGCGLQLAVCSSVCARGCMLQCVS